MRYVAHRQIGADPSPNYRLARHILPRLQRAQESHDIGLAGPSPSRPPRLPSRQHRQRSLLVGLGVDVGGIERHVSEPSPDRVDVDARLQEMTGGGMANDVGTLQRRHRGTQLCDVAFNERVNAITCQRLSATVQKQVRLRRTLLCKVTKVSEGCGLERAAPLLLPFARDQNRLGVPVDVADAEGSRFADASTGVVKEQLQRMVAPSLA